MGQLKKKKLAWISLRIINNPLYYGRKRISYTSRFNRVFINTLRFVSSFLQVCPEDVNWNIYETLEQSAMYY